MAGWEHFHHAADIGVRGRGETLATAFEQAARALIAVIADSGTIHQELAVAIKCDAPDHETLLVDWLNSLIFEMATRRMLFSRFDVDIENKHLTATAWGEAINPPLHRPTVEVKGATYTELKVCRNADGDWLAQCVVDL